jgi:uncharacterized protein (DUF58 family)
MLTSRGFWFLLFNLVMLGTGSRIQNSTLGALALTLLLWFFWEWLIFSLRVHGLASRLRMVRQVRDGRGPVDSLWAGQTFQVQVQLRLSALFPLPYVKMTDRLPFGIDEVRGDSERDGLVAADQPLEVHYHFRCPSPGWVRFEGVGVQLADLQGFFYYRKFIARPRQYRVLPPLAHVRGHGPAVKRHNMLPLLGVHRHRRPGSGSELLDLRDYLPGDPPKTIAWKASARRDRLMTKEFESEVPVRCTLFVDTSRSVRVGPPGKNALARLVEISASVAQASAAARDLTGLCLFDEKEAQWIRPARGASHLIQMFNLLADAAGKSPTTGEVAIRPLLRMAYGLALELYPDLMRKEVNHSPWWLPWLWPQPLYTSRRPTAADKFDHWLFLIWLAVWGAGLGLLLWSVENSFRSANATAATWFARIFFWLVFTALMGTGFFLSLSLLRGYLLFMPSRRRFFHRRKRLAALLSLQYGLGPGGLALLLEDDIQFNRYLQRFLADHLVPYPLPLYDRKGKYLFAAPEKINVLATALVRAVGKGHDNELFVLMADLLELEDQLGPLLRAIKVARARHHRVLIICPWPPSVPPPEKEDSDQDRNSSRRQRGAPDRSARFLLTRTTAARFNRAYHHLRRAFARLGVPLLCAQEGEPVPLILQRMEQLRLLERKR